MRTRLNLSGMRTLSRGRPSRASPARFAPLTNHVGRASCKIYHRVVELPHVASSIGRWLRAFYGRAAFVRSSYPTTWLHTVRVVAGSRSTRCTRAVLRRPACDPRPHRPLPSRPALQGRPHWTLRRCCRRPPAWWTTRCRAGSLALLCFTVRSRRRVGAVDGRPLCWLRRAPPTTACWRR